MRPEEPIRLSARPLQIRVAAVFLVVFVGLTLLLPRLFEIGSMNAAVVALMFAVPSMIVTTVLWIRSRARALHEELLRRARAGSGTVIEGEAARVPDGEAPADDAASTRRLPPSGGR